MPPAKKGFEFYRDVLGSPKYVVAPMVDASELAWRQLSRKYAADLCYTPMFHSAVFVKDKKYRKDSLQTCGTDRPLIVQFCANDPDIFLEACKLTVEAIDCDGIDLNLGCPQIIAKRGHFGSYLQDEWDLITRIISKAVAEINIPITAKCRIFPEISKSVEYALMLEKAGAEIITVHGRTRDQKGPLTGLANWDYIKAVREAVSVPVFANGNIQYLADADRCIAETGVQGVMSAEGNLTNPALYAGINPPVWEMCNQYLDLVDQYPCPTSYIRGHLFKMLNHCFIIKENADLRQVVAKSHSLPELRGAIDVLKSRFDKYHNGEEQYEMPDELKPYNLRFPPWICQPYVRAPPEQFLEKMKKVQEAQTKKRKEEKEREGEEDGDEEEEEGGMSKRKKKRKERNPYKPFSKARANCALCESCGNPSGLKCLYQLCKPCCKNKAYKEDLDCPGHKVFVKTNRAKGRARYAERNAAAAKLDEHSAANAQLDENLAANKQVIENLAVNIQVDETVAATEMGLKNNDHQNKVLLDIDIENNTKNCDTASDIDDINKCCPKDVMES